MFALIRVNTRTSSHTGGRRPLRCRRRLSRSLVPRPQTRLPRASPVKSVEAERLRSLGYVSGHVELGAAAGADPKTQIAGYVDYVARFTEGVDALQAGRQPEAERILKDLAHRFPASYEAHQYLGRSLAARGAHDEAIRAFDVAHRLSPQTALVEYDVAKSLAAKRQFDAALEHVDKGLALEPETFYGYLTKGDVLRAAGDRAKATDAFQKALALSPGLAVAEYELGRLAEDAGDWPGALRHYQRALSSDATMSAARSRADARRTTSGRSGSAMTARRRRTTPRPPGNARPPAPPIWRRPWLWSVALVLLGLGAWSVVRIWPVTAPTGVRLGRLPSGVRPGDLNVLLVTLDTTRADRLGAYGFKAIETPNLDRIAHEGVLFEQAVTPAPLTLPAHSSIFTSKLPPAHGVRDNGGFFLDDRETTMAERLKSRGFRTGGFVGAYVLDHKWGVAQGFEKYFDDFDLSKYRSVSLSSVERRGDEVADHAIQWLDTVGSSRFFAWVHFYDAHSPYDPPEPYQVALPRSAVRRRDCVCRFAGRTSPRLARRAPAAREDDRRRHGRSRRESGRPWGRHARLLRLPERACACRC